ncbi:MAG: ProQ/FinO family protein [Burkholderiaceae bacterium]|jgi:hypothetical protein|nr:ProQ/FinO family protein [Burkholderiaceae bacterium]
MTESPEIPPTPHAPEGERALTVKTAQPQPPRDEYRHRKEAKDKANAPSAWRAHPLLERLTALYPRLFGAQCLPLKRGIYEDLLARNGDALPASELKAALGQYARSTRYLNAIASGLARHDLDGQMVEPVSTEHRHHAILEVFCRYRNARNTSGLRHQNPRTRALRRLIETIETSGLSHADYLEQMKVRDEDCAALLDEAFNEVNHRTAKNAALRRAFEASGKTTAEFAEMYGLPLHAVIRALEQRTNADAMG